MPLRFIILTIVTLLYASAMAQSPIVWARYYQGEYETFIHDIKTGVDGTYFFTGNKYMQVEGDIRSHGWYVNLNPQGQKITSGYWSEGYHTSGSTIKVLGPDSYSIIGSGGSEEKLNMVYVTVNPRTNEVHKTIYTKLMLYSFYECLESQNGNLIISNTEITNNFYPKLIRFRNKDTTLMDIVSFNSSQYTYAHALYEKENGNIVIAANKKNFGENSRNVLIELDRDLKILWEKEMYKLNYENIYTLLPLENGDYIVSGSRKQSMSSFTETVWYARIDSRGNIIWERELDSFYHYTSNQLTSYGAGYFVFTGLKTGSNVYVMIFDQTGKPAWEYTYETPGTETIHGLTVGQKGEIVVAGSYNEKTAPYPQGFVYCISPKPIMNIRIYDAQNKQTLSATVSVKFEDGSIKEFTTDSTGVTISIPQNESCILQIEALGYVSQQDIVITPEEAKPEYTVYLDRLKAGTNMVMKHVQFERGTTTLLSDSYAELDKLVQFLKDHPEVKIELSGHTDNGGLPKANQALSEQRVVTVKDYLVSKGIAANRITGKGYGGKKPIAPNDTEENKSKNRRVEVKIL